jgi:hypothetical protein
VNRPPRELYAPSSRLETAARCSDSQCRSRAARTRVLFGECRPYALAMGLESEDGALRIPGNHDARLRIAVGVFDFIEREVRPFLAAGGRLWSKGSRGYPSQLRQMLLQLDKTHAVTFATHDAMLLDPNQREVEHVIPIKRIVIEIVDPSQADPRCNSRFDPIAGGPAASPDDLLSVFDRLLVKCWVTADEHDRLNRAGRSLQWDAPDGDGWLRYKLAAVTPYRLTANGATTPIESLPAGAEGNLDRTR